MKITAVFQGIMSDWIGMEQADFDLREGAVLADLLAEIFNAFREKSPEQLWNHEHGAFARPVRAFTGESPINDTGAPLTEGQEVIFCLMLAGG
ncbi:MAG: hypothetical protein JRK53_15745 [Deltaproteobacteria bacterium]|nr:hypothetical protein [Deltaproteobacteria bacterium]MBW1818296.1 hypothetical protein [Deltaproteobacteria bacterium]